MCNEACLEFGRSHLTKLDIYQKSILEVGSLNVNGSLRDYILTLDPGRYIGVDIFPGPGVDVICSVDRLVERFGRESFDVVISTEMIEHVRDWRTAITNMKSVLRPKGALFITTRSKGYGYHGYPFDFWRYETKDMEEIFSDFVVESVGRDRLVPGVFLKVRKPYLYSPDDLSRMVLYSIVTGQRIVDVTNVDIQFFKIAHTLRELLSKYLPPFLKRALKNLLPKKDNITAL